MHGGGHERGLRSGTLPTHQIVGMGEAYAIARAEMGSEIERIRMLHGRVLHGLGLSDELAHSSLRMTIGRFTTEAEIDSAVQTVREQLARLRDLSPLWEMYKGGVDLDAVQWVSH